MRQTLLLIAFAAALTAQPRVTSVGQAADFTGPLAPGTLATLFGSALATATAGAEQVPLPTTLGGTTVRVNGQPVPLTFVSPTQVNFQLPARIATGSASLTVTVGTATSAATNFTVAATAPGIFQYGANRGVVQNQDYSLNADSNLAKRGEVLTVYLTGIGITQPVVPEGTVAPSSPLARPQVNAQAYLGGSPARILFLGLTPGAIGLAQANIEVPALLASGNYPLVLEVGGVSSRPVQVSVEGRPDGTLPEGLRCFSGSVESVTRSLEKEFAGQPDEIELGSIKLCPTCSQRQPINVVFTRFFEKARASKLLVDACYDDTGNISLLRMRR
ncbi:MAG: hypothetical protein K7J47_21220 [Acidobacteria bacterium]|jgi:uncharacterized protein (TIGR03437 family)|nr:hypothetical protein [Bryobacteraceae bacterium CoA2 C42]